VVVVVGFVGVGVSEVRSEDSFAVGFPKGEVDLSRTQGVDRVGRLEEPKLVAVLVGPLSQIAVHVDGLVLQRDRIILIEVHSQVCALGVNMAHLVLQRFVLNEFEVVTHFDSTAILHHHGVDV